MVYQLDSGFFLRDLQIFRFTPQSVVVCWGEASRFVLIRSEAPALQHKIAKKPNKGQALSN